MRMVFVEALKRLPGHLLCASRPKAELENGKLECLICLDEAAQLFQTYPNDTIDQSGFGAWRRALRHRATSEDRQQIKLQFFGVVTDTSSRVSYLSPPKVQDRSIAASSLLGDLAPPLWQIESFDVLADRKLYGHDHLPVRSDHLSDDYYRKFFSFGRTLFGALLRNHSISVEDVKDFLAQGVWLQSVL